MCEEVSYQSINTTAVNQAIFCSYEKFSKIIIENKTLELTVSTKAGIHVFEFI